MVHDGTYVFTDYAYDDRGANTEHLARRETRPTTRRAGERDDLIDWQIGLDAAGLRVAAILETLTDPSLPVLGVGFDTDADFLTGAPLLPGGGRPAGPLGLERLLMM